MKSKTTSTKNKDWVVVVAKKEPLKRASILSPTFSWEKPIELEILEFCNKMAREFRTVEVHNRDEGLFGTGLFADNGFSQQAGHIAMAYETIAKHIRNEIKRRK